MVLPEPLGPTTRMLLFSPVSAQAVLTRCPSPRVQISPIRSAPSEFLRLLELPHPVVDDPQDDLLRRLADLKFGGIHPCATFPLSDLEIIVPADK